MNHPKPEEWVPFLYGETTSPVRRDLKAHLDECPECRREIDTWKRSLRQLDRWKVRPSARPLLGTATALLKWSAATAVILLAGIVIGRATVPRVNAEQLRASLAPAIKREVTAELVQLVRDEATKSAALTLRASHKYTDQVTDQLYVALKKDVDTVALNADAGLRHTAQQLVQLADYQAPQTPDVPNQ